MVSSRMWINRARRYVARKGGVSLDRKLMSTSESETVNYANRKTIIEQKPQGYYPPIDTIRPNDAKRSRIPSFRQSFEMVDFVQYPSKRYPELYNIEGKITSIRKSGKAMYFIDLIQDGAKVQIMASNKLMQMTAQDFDDAHAFFRKGDFISCVGHPSVTNVGELSLKLCRPIKLASPCLNLMTIPDKIKDRGLINSNRVLNYLVNADLKQRLMIKSIVIQAIRQFFVKRDFMEVQTPILGGYGTGANAEPFKTILKALKSTGDGNNKYLQLRVAPELWLKKLIISGFDKIFEIGQNFRNEGIDLTHNPEFTTCEFYQSFTNLNELMILTEELFVEIFDTLKEKKLSLVDEQLPSLSALASGTFPKYEFIPTLELKTGVVLPSELTAESLIEYYKSIGLEVPALKSPSNLLDNLSSIYLESISQDTKTPIFIYNQPSVLSPLAKSAIIDYDGRSYDISLRFELFIQGKEYVNSYEEENSPFEQSKKFKLQQLAKTQFNDNEMIIPDWEYIKLMEYGLPPTGGWGCGIDRLCMLFSGSERIEEVLSFGNIRDVVRQ